jgi:neutral ceramidase
MGSVGFPRSRRARRFAIAALLSTAFIIFWGWKRQVEPVPTTAKIDPPAPPTEVDAAIVRCLGSSEYVVGAARSDVTGPVTDISTGYNEPGVTMDGLAMRLYARAFVIESPCSGHRIAYVNVDVLHMYQSLKTGVLKRLARKLPGEYDASNVLLAGTHDHSAPSNVAFRTLYNQANGVRGFDRLNYDIIVDGIVDAIVRAHNSRRPATIEVARGHLPGATHNRSALPYAQNPDAADYPENVDDTMTLLRFTGTDGAPIGALNWFAHHPTSLNHEVRLVHGDSKGYAAYRMEQEMSKLGGAHFVAGFSNGAMGDVTMNAPNPRDPVGPFLRPSDVDPSVTVYDDARIHGNIQYQEAMRLYQGAAERVHGGVYFKHRYLEFQNLPVDPAYGAPPGARTCVAAIGAGFVSGTEEGGTVLFPSLHEGELVYRGRPANPFIGSEMRRCQAEKQVLLPAGDMPLFFEPWVDTIVPFQVLAIGNVGIVGTSFEQTTMVGRRVRKVLQATLGVMGATDVVIASIANSYNMYMTTREEYAKQHFEGSFTHFGPWSAAAWLEQTDRLARALVEGRDLPRGPEPADRSSEMHRTWIDAIGVLLDAPPWNGAFGDIAKDVDAKYPVGSHRVSVTFWSAHPRTAQLRQRAGALSPSFTYLEVQRQEGSDWTTLATDADPTTRFRWKRWGNFMVPLSQTTIEWDPGDAAQGTYRIVHHGVAKHSWLGFFERYETFEGKSSTFTLVAN